MEIEKKKKKKTSSWQNSPWLPAPQRSNFRTIKCLCCPVDARTTVIFARTLSSSLLSPWPPYPNDDCRKIKCKLNLLAASPARQLSFSSQLRLLPKLLVGTQSNLSSQTTLDAAIKRKEQ